MNESETVNKPQIELKDKLQYETLKTLAVQGKSSFVVSMVNGGIVYLVLNPVVGGQIMLLWLSTLITLTLIRVLMITGFFRLDETEVELGSWKLAYMLLAYVSAGCWGALPLLFEFTETQWASTFVIFVISGMSAGALVSLYAMLSIVIPYLVIILLPLLYVIASTPNPAALGMSLLTGFYLMLLVRSAYMLNASVQKSLRLELENEELFDFLVNARHNPDQQMSELDKSKHWQGYDI